MIDRLNFYDLYGYLIPGLCLLGMLWFPFWYSAGVELPKEWTSALAALVGAYVAGHVLQRLSRSAFPSDIQGVDGCRRWPSDYLLDDEGHGWRPASAEVARQRLSAAVREGVLHSIDARFGIAVEPNGVAEITVRQRRQDAFLLCRRALMHDGGGSYAEQFEGLYSLMRGLSGVATLSVGYLCGWMIGRALASWMPAQASAVDYMFLAAAAAAAMAAWPSTPGQIFWTIACVSLPIGLHLGVAYGPPTATVAHLMLFPISALVLAAAQRQFQGAYEFFAVHFAATVYRDFYVLATDPER